MLLHGLSPGPTAQPVRVSLASALQGHKDRREPAGAAKSLGARSRLADLMWEKPSQAVTLCMEWHGLQSIKPYAK